VKHPNGEGMSYYDYWKMIKSNNSFKTFFNDTVGIKEHYSKEFNTLKTILENEKHLPVVLFKSFLKVIDMIMENNLDIGFIFRSFGNDALFVENQLKIYMNNKYNKNVSASKYVLNRIDFGTFSLKKLDDTSNHIGFDTSSLSIWFESLEDQFIFIKDDYEFWSKNNKVKESSKIIFESEKFIRFFDDNSCVHIHSESGSPVSNLFFRVDTYEAICDENYYINLIKQQCQ